MRAAETVAMALAHAAEEARALLAQLAADAGPTLERMSEGCVASLQAGGKILLAGNGGSAAQCQHLATELVCRFATDRAAYAAIALTTDTSLLTACANDYSFDEVFARQIEALGREGDVLLALSTSGASANVLRAVEAAKSRAMPVYALSGGDGGRLAATADIAITVPHRDSSRIQEAHLFLGHLLCGAIENGLRG